MNANHRDIMEQYCRPHIMLDKFSSDEIVVCYHKNCTPTSEIIIVMQPDRVNLNKFSKSPRTSALLPVYQIIRKQSDKFIVR